MPQDSNLLRESAEAMGVGQYANLFPLMFTMRSVSSKTRLGDRMTKEERERVHKDVLPKGFNRNDFDLSEVCEFDISACSLVCTHAQVHEEQRICMYASCNFTRM